MKIETRQDKLLLDACSCLCVFPPPNRIEFCFMYSLVKYSALRWLIVCCINDCYMIHFLQEKVLELAHFSDIRSLSCSSTDF